MCFQKSKYRRRILQNDFCSLNMTVQIDSRGESVVRALIVAEVTGIVDLRSIAHIPNDSGTLVLVPNILFQQHTCANVELKDIYREHGK